jgi:voltage-gated potassium channel
LNNHFIVCGFGRVGRGIANTLKQEGAKFVVIEKNEEGIISAQQLNYLIIQDDATKDEMLKKARIDSARGLIAAFGNDADNTYVTLAARELNADIPIIARANNEEAIKKLKQAGANHVIAPEAIGGQQMARLAIRPKTVQFIETVLSYKGEELLVEEVKIAENSAFIGSTVKQVEDNFPRIKILAIKTRAGAILLNPHPATTIDKESSLTAFGPVEQLQNMEGCCENTKAISARSKE